MTGAGTVLSRSTWTPRSRYSSRCVLRRRISAFGSRWKTRGRYAGTGSADDYRGIGAGFRRVVPRYGESDVGDGRSAGDAGDSGAVCDDNARKGFGDFRASEGRGGAVGGAGGRGDRLDGVLCVVSEGLPAGAFAAGDYYGASAAGSSLLRERLVEVVPEDAGVGVCAISKAWRIEDILIWGRW